MQIHHRIPTFFICLAYSITITAESLDLSGINDTNLRQKLDPINRIIAAEQTPPLTLLSFDEHPIIVMGAASPVLEAAELQSLSLGYPSFWFRIAITPNLTVGANTAGTPWRQDNIYSVGPFICSSWGTARKSISTTAHFHHLKGPDHFHLNNIAFSISRILRYEKWIIGYGFAAHSLRTSIHVTNQPDPAQSYSALKKLKQNFLQLGVYRHINADIDLGSEVFASTSTVMIKLLFTLTI